MECPPFGDLESADREPGAIADIGDLSRVATRLDGPSGSDSVFENGFVGIVLGSFCFVVVDFALDARCFPDFFCLGEGIFSFNFSLTERFEIFECNPAVDHSQKSAIAVDLADGVRVCLCPTGDVLPSGKLRSRDLNSRSGFDFGGSRLWRLRGATVLSTHIVRFER